MPLWGRAKEYEGENSLIKDRYAHKIIEKLDFDFNTIHKMPVFLDLIHNFPESEMTFEIYSKIVLWFNNLSAKKQKLDGEVKGHIRWAVNSAKKISTWSSHIEIIDEYPFYSRVDLEAYWDKKYLFPIKILSLLKGVKMVHLKFTK